nr:hypothetical protein [uncultured Ottowia sp.]
MSNETPRSEESGDSGALHSALNSAFDYVIENRSDYYRKNPSNLPQLDSVSGLISSYTRNNAAISGGASLIPGPWGMAAVIPELTLVIRNQIQMVYDIGVANGKQAQLTKELLMGIFLTAMGSSAGSLLTIHGGKILVRRASLQVIQKIIAMLGGRVTQQVIKSTVSKWLPVVGAGAMAAWTGYMTKNIGEKANELFKLEIEDDPQTLDIELKPE